MLRAGRVRGDEWQADRGLRHRRQFHLGLLRRLEEPLQRLRVLPQVDSVVTLELVSEVVNEPTVEVVTTEVGVASRRAHLDDAVANVEDADVKCAAAEIEDQNGLALLLVEAVGQRGGGRLVDDSQHFEPGDAAGVLRRLPLCIVEVRGDRDDRLCHFLP